MNILSRFLYDILGLLSNIVMVSRLDQASLLIQILFMRIHYIFDVLYGIVSQCQSGRQLLAFAPPCPRQCLDNDLGPFLRITWLLPVVCLQSRSAPLRCLFKVCDTALYYNLVSTAKEVGTELARFDSRHLDTQILDFGTKRLGEYGTGCFSCAVQTCRWCTSPTTYRA